MKKAALGLLCTAIAGTVYAGAACAGVAPDGAESTGAPALDPPAPQAATPSPGADGSPASDGDAWAARAAAGYTKTGGITDTSTANALFHVAHVIDRWKLLFAVDGLYGSTAGETTAQAWHAHLQGNYSLTERLYWYGAGQYDDDRFSGFAYQRMVSTGVGYDFLKTESTKLSAQIGVGEQWLRPELLTENAIGAIISTTELAAEKQTVLDAAAHLEHSFNPQVKFIAGFSTESGNLNSSTAASVALQVKMTNTLALSASYQFIRNSNPPPGIEPRSTLATLNLVYELKNPKLAPE